MYISITANYQNDDGDGISIQVAKPGGNVDHVVSAIHDGVAQLRDSQITAADAERFLRDLLEVSDSGETLNPHDRLLVVSLIAYLEATGHLKADDHNGCQYVQVMETPTQH